MTEEKLREANDKSYALGNLRLGKKWAGEAVQGLTKYQVSASTIGAIELLIEADFDKRIATAQAEFDAL